MIDGGGGRRGGIPRRYGGFAFGGLHDPVRLKKAGRKDFVAQPLEALWWD